MSGIGDKMRGKAEEMTGNTKVALGDALDNERLQGEGMVDQAKGKGQQAKGGVKDKLDDLGDKLAGAADRTPDAGERGAGRMGTGSGQLSVKAEDMEDGRNRS